VEALSLICSSHRQDFNLIFGDIQTKNNLSMLINNETLYSKLCAIPEVVSMNKWFSERNSEHLKIGYLKWLELISYSDSQCSLEFIAQVMQNLKDLALFDFPEYTTSSSKNCNRKNFEKLFKESCYNFINKF